ncbi:3-hydroxyacyl-CoA dehydrogenase NAD-binding domain-containing protein [Prosthecomicrobium hirschii]|uniref:3-hydroxyacyl-CoA dehydrogenase NAD-binding domain-containing protein n=1 Tax=Prosthecodimorpha hirschii TaxID=665126 RepID=UPI00221EDCE2|nr:3-hydroxyacyl-CoA dehydrogenase NAD-binding domain-containing protein [Prosthecomicrobium hirschii]MCW1838796.1 3-hydroxyacyl-CoA dehydrogenase NAD-binding domain-containing protein [Prosthecomicrobium hirschii]
MASGPVVIEVRGKVAIVWVDNPPVNALSQAVRQGLSDAVAAVEADAKVAAALILCRGRTFIAGADIREFGKGPLEPLLTDVIARIEASPKPWAAAIHGTALGGGFEVALGCCWRVMDSRAEVGLPEVKLGIIPGAGGTQRLPRLTGVATAIEVVTSGRRIGAGEAQKLGIADAVVDLEPGEEFADRALAAVEAWLAAGTMPVPVSARPVPPLDAAEAEKLIAKAVERARGQLSPGEAARAVADALTLDFAAGLAAERARFLKLVGHPQAKALRHAFFGERELSKLPMLDGVKPRAVSTIAVVGGGTMGAGIAVAAADAGYTVTVLETDAAAAKRAAERIHGIYQGYAERKRIPADAVGVKAAAIDITTEIGDLGTADLVVEAVFEDAEVKRDLFRRLDKVVRPGAVMATNTSYLDPNRIAAATGRPAEMCGLHFFAPANVMRLVEVIETADTAPDVLATAFAVALKLGKLPVFARVCDGFIGNRIWATVRRHYEFLVEDGASPAEIDAAMTAYGFPMGPFAVYDLSGLDISWSWRKRNMADRAPDVRYVDIPDRLCEMGRLGRKTGAGWYDYASGKAKTDPVVEALIAEERARKGVTARPVAAETIQRRALAVMANEGARILEEGIALRPLDVDMVMIHGYGYPAWRGGPMFEADAIGLPTVLGWIEEAHAAGGPGFEPARLLVELVQQGRTLADWAQSR